VAGSFGVLLRAHRRAAGLTQDGLAELAALSGQAVGALERGDRQYPHRETVDRLAVALGLSAEQRAAFTAAAARPSAPRPPVGGQEAARRRVHPRQLPAPIAHFAGRDKQAKAMLELIGSSSTVVVSAISGMAGVGKTAFAVHWAYQVREQFPDGQLYVNLRGFYPGRAPMAPPHAVRSFLEALGVAPQRIPGSTETQVGLYRSLLADRRILIVLDNAADAEQVRPLLPGAGGCLALVTSRDQLTSLVASDGAQLVTLDLLTELEAHDLLSARLGPQRVSAEPAAAREIIDLCGRLPLALAIVAARAEAHPDFSLVALAKDLRGQNLDAFAGADPITNMRTVFAASYQVLSPAAARLFRLLSTHPGPDISVAAAQSLSGGAVQPQLAELMRANLIVEQRPGRYTLHDLLRAYAAEQPDPERDAATHRMLDHYLHTAVAADRHMSPTRDPIVVDRPASGTEPERPGDQREALDWFSAEHSVLLSVVEYAGNSGWDRHTWQLAWALTDFFHLEHWQDEVATQGAAVQAARRLGDAGVQARAHRLLATAHTQLGQFEQANEHLERALGLATDPLVQAHTLMHLTFLLVQQERQHESLHHAQRALALYDSVGHRAGRAQALNAVGWIHARLGDHRQALIYCEQSLALQEELGERRGIVATLDSLGHVHFQLGDYELALSCHARALDLSRSLGMRYEQAQALIHLGETHLAMGRPDAARTAWRSALEIMVELDHPHSAMARERLAHP